MSRPCAGTGPSPDSGDGQGPHSRQGLTLPAPWGYSNVETRQAAALLGQELVAISLSGRVPGTARTASNGVATGVGKDRLPLTTQGKGGVAESAQHGY